MGIMEGILYILENEKLVLKINRIWNGASVFQKSYSCHSLGSLKDNLALKHQQLTSFID